MYSVYSLQNNSQIPYPLFDLTIKAKLFNIFYYCPKFKEEELSFSGAESHSPNLVELGLLIPDF